MKRMVEEEFVIVITGVESWFDLSEIVREIQEVSDVDVEVYQDRGDVATPPASCHPAHPWCEYSEESFGPDPLAPTRVVCLTHPDPPPDEYAEEWAVNGSDAEYGSAMVRTFGTEDGGDAGGWASDE